MYDAFDHGVRSVESDIWYDNSTKEFYVAHTELEIDHAKTFQTQTIEPLLKIMEGNYSRHFASGDADKFVKAAKSATTSTPDWYHYYAEGYGGVRPLQLIVEIKSNDGEYSWPRVVQALEPFRKRGWLTKFENGKVHYGPLIVVGTGGTPRDLIAGASSRDFFFDCGLGNMNDTFSAGNTTKSYDATLCPISSMSYIDVPDANLGLLPPPPKSIPQYHKLIKQAHEHKTTTRFYGILPGSIARYDDFNMLLQQGSDWLNVDLFEDVTAYTSK